MIIDKLYLKDFRNYHELRLNFHPNINVLVGDNAQGKTNIIEAIYMSALGKSYRTNKEQELIRWNQNHYQIKTALKHEQRDLLIELGYAQNGQKNLKLNGVVKSRLVDIIGNLRIVIFTPEDLMLVKAGPSIRRKFMDSNISQISPKYLYNLQQYAKILEQKNTLLKAIRNRQQTSEMLSVWNSQLAQNAALIIQKRLEFMERLNVEACRIHNIISSQTEQLKLVYKAGTQLTNDEIKSLKTESLVEAIHDKLDSISKEECTKGYSVLGTHRDDILIFINGLDAKSFGSQGQQRTSVLSLKLAEVQYIKDESGTFPVLLLDDVMSELDQKRRNFLLATVLNKVQMFITTTDLEHISEEILHNCNIFNVLQGSVTVTGG